MCMAGETAREELPFCGKPGCGDGFSGNFSGFLHETPVGCPPHPSLRFRGKAAGEPKFSQKGVSQGDLLISFPVNSGKRIRIRFCIPPSFSTLPRTFSPRSPLYFLEISSFPPGMCVIFLIIRAQRNHNKNTEKTAGEQEKSTRAGKCRSRGTDFSKEATVPTASATIL